MTNLEWIRTLSEEEFADWLYDEWLHHLQYRWSSSRGGLIIWLKDRKTEPMKTTDYCDICKRDMCEDCIADATNPYCVPSHYEINYEPKDEPKTQMKTQNSNLTFEKSDCPWK